MLWFRAFFYQNYSVFFLNQRFGSINFSYGATLRIILGGMIFSQIVIYLLFFGIFKSWAIFLIKIFGFSFFVYNALIILRAKKIKAKYEAIILPSILFVTAAFVCLSALDTPVPFHDARQYHLALPWLMSQNGALFIEPSLQQAGLYLGYDVLYMALGDLSTLLDNPRLMASLHIFSALSPLILIVGTYFLAMALGAGRVWSLLAAGAVFTMGSIVYWGTLKNDLIAAGIGVFALTHLCHAWKSRLTSDVILASILAAFAVSIKISNILPVGIPFAYALLFGPFGAREKGLGIVLGLLVIAPWMAYATTMQSTPLYPIGAEVPAEVKIHADERNANGLSRDMSTAFTRFFDIILDRYKISGNHTLGIPFLFAFGITVIGVLNRFLQRQFDIQELIAVSSIIWFLIFYILYFDGTFESRYIIICGSLFFVYSAVVFNRVAHAWHVDSGPSFYGLAGFVLVGLIAGIYAAPSTTTHLKRAQTVVSRGVSEAHSQWIMQFYDWTKFHREVNRIANGQGVAINDHFLLFLDPPIQNLHAIHTPHLNLYLKDSDFVEDLLRKRGIQTFVNRPGISGATDAVDDFLDRCGTAVTDMSEHKDARRIYRIKENCR